MKECWVVDAGLLDYEKALDLQEKLLELRSNNAIPDVLLLLEHHPVITMGRKATEDMLRIPRRNLELKGIKVIDINRGGKVTFHGPGQLVGYVIRSIELEELDKYLNGLEDMMIKVAKEYGVDAFKSYEVDTEKNKRLVGAWCRWIKKDYKLGAIGIEVRNKTTMHGFAFNVSTNMAFFDFIDQCGFKDKKAISLQKVTGSEVDLEEVKQKIASLFAHTFRYETKEMSLAALQNIVRQTVSSKNLSGSSK